MAATFILSNVTHAQESAGPALDTATREADRYVACWMTNETCFGQLTDTLVLDAVGLLYGALRNGPFGPPPVASRWGDSYRIELAPHWGPFATVDRLVKIVPFFESVGEDSRGQRLEGRGYLIASSYDNGQSWRFARVDRVTPELEVWMDELVPGATGTQWPVVGVQVTREPVLERSRSLRTTERRFVQADDGFVYAMKWDMRSEIEDAVNLVIRYDNPADRSQPLRFRGSLEPGQQELEWRSPALTGFEPDQEYDVVVEASDPDSGELLFEHRQSVLFRPTLEIWRAEMPQPPAPNPSRAPGP